MAVSPPLNAVRAFEAVARTGAFTTAGTELGVTSAAVSQQVRNLESFWNKNLFIRQGNRLVLSEAGLAAYPAAAQAMNTLTDLSDTMRDSRILPSLVLSAPHSVVQTWLPEKLTALNQGGGSRSNIRLHVRPDEDPVGFAKDGIHMRIFYGHELYRDYLVETLFHDHVTAVASPGFVELHGNSVNAIDERHLIHTLWGPDYASFPSWANCLSSTRAIDVAAGLSLTTSSAAIAFARKGLGVGLVPSQMAKEEIANGVLMRMESPEPLMPHPYCLAYPHALRGRRDVQQVAAALLDSHP
ncbi:MAG: LysR family transcriptional regulator [Rhizobiaceae bacterium]|nr:LysR family transcriptional regulator [Rhizobiaceae bacterium]